jgi:hypothetical protein
LRSRAGRHGETEQRQTNDPYSTAKHLQISVLAGANGHQAGTPKSSKLRYSDSGALRAARDAAQQLLLPTLTRRRTLRMYGREPEFSHPEKMPREESA